MPIRKKANYQTIALPKDLVEALTKHAQQRNVTTKLFTAMILKALLKYPDAFATVVTVAFQDTFIPGGHDGKGSETTAAASKPR